MTTLTREAILAAPDLKTETVECPEWGGTVLVRTLMGDAREAFEDAVSAKASIGTLRARVVAASVVDDAGNFMFTEADLVALSKKSGAVLDRIFDVACRLSVLRKEDAEALKGNFKPGPGAVSTSG